METVLLGIFSIGAFAACATTYYWNPITKNSDGYYHWDEKTNWLLADGSAATGYPNANDAEVVITNNLHECRPAGKCAHIVWRGVSTTLTQGTLTLVAGGAGLDLTQASGSPALYCSLALSGSGEVIVDTATRGMAVQKNFTGTDAVLVKRGNSLLTLANNTARTFSAGGLRLEDGSLAFGNLNAHTGNSFDIAFSGNAGARAITLNYADLSVPSLRIRETNGVSGTAHGFITSKGYRICHTGGKTAMPDSDFSGTLYGNIGVMWKPYSSETEFVFRKAAHETTGELVVSNGAIRVTDGATFPSVPRVEISGASSKLVVDVGGAAAFPVAKVEINAGGMVEVPNARLVTLPSVTVDGTAVPAGHYKPAGTSFPGTEAAWLTGTGYAIVGIAPETDAASLTWDGAGSDTKATTLANWHGAASLPALNDGSAVVNVTGGTGFTADSSVWVKGFTNNATAFSLAAAAGARIELGSGGLVNAGGGTFTLSGLSLTADQTWKTGAGTFAVVDDVETCGPFHQVISGAGAKSILKVDAATPSWTNPLSVTNCTVQLNASGALGPRGAAPAYVYTMPSFAGGISVDRDLWLCNGGTIFATANSTLTFNG